MLRTLVTLLLLVSPALFGQAQSGTIAGTITDPAGAVISAAKVTLVNEGTNFTRSVGTNESVQFVAYSVPTGAYSITVEQSGFQKLVRSGIQLTAGSGSVLGGAVTGEHAHFLEMFNAFNRANFGVPNANIGNAVASQISSTAPARIMQMALKITF